MRTFGCVLIGFVFVLAVTLKLSAHEEGEQPQKVTSMTISDEHSDEMSASPQMATSSANETAEKDFDSIRREMTGSIPLVIIKALALAAAVGGVAYLYLRRSRKGKAE